MQLGDGGFLICHHLEVRRADCFRTPRSATPDLRSTGSLRLPLSGDGQQQAFCTKETASGQQPSGRLSPRDRRADGFSDGLPQGSVWWLRCLRRFESFDHPLTTCRCQMCPLGSGSGERRHTCCRNHKGVRQDSDSLNLSCSGRKVLRNGCVVNECDPDRPIHPRSC